MPAESKRIRMIQSFANDREAFKNDVEYSVDEPEASQLISRGAAIEVSAPKAASKPPVEQKEAVAASPAAAPASEPAAPPAAPAKPEKVAKGKSAKRGK